MDKDGNQTHTRVEPRKFGLGSTHTESIFIWNLNEILRTRILLGSGKTRKFKNPDLDIFYFNINFLENI